MELGWDSILSLGDACSPDSDAVICCLYPVRLLLMLKLLECGHQGQRSAAELASTQDVQLLLCVRLFGFGSCKDVLEASIS